MTATIPTDAQRTYRRNGWARKLLCGRRDDSRVIKQSIESAGKSWFIGPWSGAVPVAVGFSGRCFDEPHTPDAMFEVYLVARGQALRSSTDGSLD